MTAAVYIRSEREIQGNPSKRTQLSEFVRFKGWNCQVFEESSLTNEGSRMKTELMSRLQRNEFDILIIYKLNDWSNTPDQLLDSIIKLTGKGIRVISYSENFDSGTPTGILFLKIMSAFSDLQTHINPRQFNSYQGINQPFVQTSGNLKISSVVQFKSLADSTDLLDYQKSTFDLIDMNGASVLTGYTKNALYGMICRGQIPYIKRPGGRKVFSQRRSYRIG